MGALILDVLLVSLAAAIGGGVGWMLRGGGPLDSAADPETEATLMRARSENENMREELHTREEEIVGLREELDAARVEVNHAKDALSELDRIANAMSDDVDEHNRSVQAISDGLEEDGDASDIVSCVERLFSANSKMQSRLAIAEEELASKQEEIASHLQEARTDALTGLANRRAFDIEMDRCEAEFKSANSPSCVMVIDVDHFKKFNDTYGHQAGDEVLRGVARVLSENVTENELVCRYGGEEFCLIFPGSDVKAAISIAEQARSAIGNATFSHEGQDLRVTASGGLAQFTSGESHEELVKRADDALYVCKESGRNCGHWHDGGEMHSMTPKKEEKKPSAAARDKSLADPLTGLGTKEPFVDDLSRRVAALKRGGEPLSVILARVDGFNAVTQGFGAPAADRVLRTTAQFMESAMRETDHLARYDLDRFGMILPSTNAQDATAIAERIRELAELSKLPTDAGLLQFTVSLGLTESLAGDSLDDVTRRMEQALQQSIEGGGNQFHNVEPEAAATTG